MLKTINKKSTTVLVVAVLATAMIMGPSLMSMDNAFATKKYKNWSDCREDHSKKWCKNYFKHHDNDDGGNSASQGIAQSQVSKQNSQVVSGGDTKNSGNNFSFQNQENKGNNALAQQ